MEALGAEKLFRREKLSMKKETQTPNEELITQRVLGTDDLSLAQGLAHSFLATVTASASEVSECLFEADTNAKQLLRLLEHNIDDTLHNLKICKTQIVNFDSLCSEIRASLCSEIRKQSA